jgi:hypothetical protein
MRLFIVGLMLAGSVTTAAAQERQVGAKAGPSLGVVAFDPATGSTYGRRVGAAGGLFAVLPLGERLALQLEGIFTPRGAKLGDPESGATSTVMLDYVDVPLLLRVNGPAFGGGRLHVVGGPYLGIRIRARRQLSYTASGFSYGTIDDMHDEVERFDGGLSAGAGVDLGRRFVVEGRYAWALTPLNTDRTDGVRIRNRVFTLLAGLRF